MRLTVLNGRNLLSNSTCSFRDLLCGTLPDRLCPQIFPLCSTDIVGAEWPMPSYPPIRRNLCSATRCSHTCGSSAAGFSHGGARPQADRHRRLPCAQRHLAADRVSGTWGQPAVERERLGRSLNGSPRPSCQTPRKDLQNPNHSSVLDEASYLRRSSAKPGTVLQSICLNPNK